MKPLVVCLKLESYSFLTDGIPTKFVHASQQSPLQRSLGRSELKACEYLQQLHRRANSHCVLELHRQAQLSHMNGHWQRSHAQLKISWGKKILCIISPLGSCTKCNPANTVDFDQESIRITKRCFPGIRNTNCTLDSSKFVNSWPKSHLTCNCSFSKYYNV